MSTTSTATSTAPHKAAHRVSALRGSDPHAFLSSLGLLLHAGPGATLEFDGTTPVLTTAATPAEISGSLFDELSIDAPEHPLAGGWCMATAGADGWADRGAPLSWTEPLFGPSWARLVRGGRWKDKEAGEKHPVTTLWLNTSSGKIGITTQVRALVAPGRGKPVLLTPEQASADVGTLLDGAAPASQGATSLGLARSRASTNHTVELLAFSALRLLPPVTTTPDGARGLTWTLWAQPLTLPEAYPVLRDPERMAPTGWAEYAAPVVSPDTGGYGKEFGSTRQIRPSTTKER